MLAAAGDSQQHQSKTAWLLGLKTLQNREPHMTTTTPTATDIEGLVWGSDDELVDTAAGGACRSPEEAKAKAIATVQALVPGLSGRSKSFVNTWKRVVWEPVNQPTIQAACVAAGVSTNTFKAFLMELASRTSWDGKDAVFTLRKTIAAVMPGRSRVTGGAGLRVIDRCMAVAVELGFVTEGFQKKWLVSHDDGTTSWKSGSAARMLLMPSFGLPAHMLQRQTNRFRAQLRRERAASDQLAAKKQRDAAHQAHVETMIDLTQDTPTRSESPSTKPRSKTVNQALAAARRALE